MKMVIAGAGIAGVPDVSDHLPLSDRIAFGQAIGVTREMSVVENQFLVSGELIDRRATAFALKELEYLAVSGGEHLCFRRRDNIDCIVREAFGAGVGKGVEQLVRAYACNGDDQV